MVNVQSVTHNAEASILARLIQARQEDLTQDEEISMVAVPPRQVSPSGNRAAFARKLEALLNRRAEKVRGVSEEELDSAIDEALEHARHSRA